MDLKGLFKCLILYVVAAFCLGLFVSRFIPIRGNGLREVGENLMNSPQDCGVKVYPYETDAKTCVDVKGNTYSSTGEDAAGWFFYGCGKEKTYKVHPNKALALVLTKGKFYFWYHKKAVFTIWEKSGGKWWKMQSVESQRDWKNNVVIPYTPKSSDIKIKAEQFFYLDVYQDKDLSKVYPQPDELAQMTESESIPEKEEIVDDVNQKFNSKVAKLIDVAVPDNSKSEVILEKRELVDYVNSEFKFKIGRFSDMQVTENENKNIVGFFDTVYGKNPLDEKNSVPAVSLRVEKCWNKFIRSCLGECISPCDGLAFGKLCNSRYHNYSSSMFSTPPSEKQVRGFMTIKIEIKCDSEEYHGLAVQKNDMIYIIMYLRASDKYAAMPSEIGNRILESFDFTEEQ